LRSSNARRCIDIWEALVRRHDHHHHLSTARGGLSQMRTTIFSTLIVMTLLLGACNTSDKNSTLNPAPTANILLLLKTADNPFFQEMERGVRQAVEASGRKVNLQVRAGDSESDVAGQ